jgi:hypothetical protein
MSDIRCVVCGEPWEAYGVNHGDMLPWEAKLFKAGAGCPCCEGVSNGYAPSTLSDVENGDEDPMDRIVAAERVADGTAPRWERPKDPILWTCEVCKLVVYTDLDTNELDYRGGRYRGRWDAKPEDKPAATLSGHMLCDQCLEHCEECGAELCNELSGDVYDGLASFKDPRGDYYSSDRVCIDCLDKAEHEEADSRWSSYSASDRIAYIRKHRSEFEFRSLADMFSCVRGNYFGGYASGLLS